MKTKKEIEQITKRYNELHKLYCFHKSESIKLLEQIREIEKYVTFEPI